MLLQEKLVLLRAHPDLAGKAAVAGQLTAESTEEQVKPLKLTCAQKRGGVTILVKKISPDMHAPPARPPAESCPVLDSFLQARAGLDALTQEEMDSFTSMNERYKTRFGWPFILAVRNATKSTILGAFKGWGIVFFSTICGIAWIVGPPTRVSGVL